MKHFLDIGWRRPRDAIVGDYVVERISTPINFACLMMWIWISKNSWAFQGFMIHLGGRNQQANFYILVELVLLDDPEQGGERLGSQSSFFYALDRCWQREMSWQLQE